MNGRQGTRDVTILGVEFTGEEEVCDSVVL